MDGQKKGEKQQGEERLKKVCERERVVCEDTGQRREEVRMHGRKTRKSQVRRDGRGDGATEERERSAGHVVEDGGRDRCRRRSCRGEVELETVTPSQCASHHISQDERTNKDTECRGEGGGLQGSLKRKERKGR